MARFNLPEVTPQTDINATLFNDMIAGIYEALSLQNTGGLYSFIFEYTFTRADLAEDKYRLYFTNSEGTTQTDQWIKFYNGRSGYIIFSDYLPSGVSFTEAPFVAVSAPTSEPLIVSANATDISSSGCYLRLQRYHQTGSTVKVFVCGKIES